MAWSNYKRRFFFCLIMYLLLSVGTSAALGGLSFRHTLFYLVMAILALWGSLLFDDRKSYGWTMLLIMAPPLSLLVLRGYASAVFHLWDFITYAAFTFSLSHLVLAFIAIVPPRWKMPIAAFFCCVMNLPVLILWGYYFAEHNWMNAMGGVALLQTNFTEAVEYVRSRVSFAGVVCVAALFVVGCGVLALARHIKWKYERGSLFVASAALFVLLNAVLLFRTHDNIVYKVYRETREFAAQYDTFKQGVQERKDNVKTNLRFASEGKPGIYALVIGESANRGHMGAYGYRLDTTPWLSSAKDNPQMILFDHGYSCHLFTVSTLSYALTTKNQYNEVDLGSAVSLIEAANAANYQTAWFSNQIKYSVWNTPYSAIADASGQQFWLNGHVGSESLTEHFDMAVVDAIDQLKIGDRMLLVFHLMGSHMSYNERYPKEFDRFHTLGRHPQYDEYDNSILYTDYVLQKLTEKLSSLPNFQCMLYFSDHSVLVDEGHDLGFDQFAYQKTHIPFCVYVSPHFQAERAETYERLRAVRHEIITNDLVFDAMLGLMDVRLAEGYEPENDITSDRYNADPSRFSTVYGKHAIADDPALHRNE